MSNERSERLAAIGELPRDVPPARNLWPGIAAAIEGSSAAPASRWGRAVPRPVWALARAMR